MPEEELLILEEPAIVDSGKGKSKKIVFPRWTRFMLVFIVIVTCLGFVVRCVQNNDQGARTDLSAVAPENKTDMAKVGLESSPHYQERIDTYAQNKAQEAAEQGRTYVAPVSPAARPVMEASPITPKASAPKTPLAQTGPAAPQSQPQYQKTREQKGDQAMIAYLSQVGQHLNEMPQPGTTIYNKPAPKVMTTAVGEVQKGGYDVTLPPRLKPGDILYALNRITLDSDAPGPAMVEVLDDGIRGTPYKGAKVIGSFKRMNGHLTLEFSTMAMPNGAIYSIKGFAIDPKTDRTAVRTSVNNHTIEKWVAFAASAFLSGWGEAVSRSGTSSYSNMYGGGYSAPNYDLKEQMIIASGKVGDKASGILERRFDIPPTVTLKSGTEMGVIIISVGKMDSPVNDAVLLQQNAVQQQEGQKTGYPRTYPTISRQVPGMQPQR